MKRILDVLDRHPLPMAVGTGLLWTVVLLVRMFWPHPVGLGDQGDGHRLLCELGLRDDRPYNTPSNGWVYFTWLDHRLYGETCGANGTGEPYYSSQLALLRAARLLTPWLGLPGALDLRALAVVCAAIVGFALTWLVMVLPGRVGLRFVAASAVGLLFADAGVANYFASPYSEPASLLSLLLLCPALLTLFRTTEPAWHHYLLVAALSGFAIASKTQMASLLPVIAVAFLWRRRSHGTVRKALARRATYAFAAVLVAGLTGLSGLYLTAQPERFSELNMYNQVFQNILPTSPDPRGDLEWFGLDPSLVRGSGSDILAATSVAADPAYEPFMEKVSPAKVALFYLTHPARLPSLLDAGLAGTAQFRLTETYIGSNPPGYPQYQADHRMQTYTYVFKVFALAPVLLLGGYWLVALLVFLVVVSRRGNDRPAQAIGKLGLVVLGCGLTQFWAVMLSEGRADLIKHMIVVDVCTALTIPLLLAAWFTRKRHDGGKATEAPETEDLKLAGGTSR